MQTTLPNMLAHDTSINAIQDENGVAMFVTAIAPPGLDERHEAAIAAEMVRRWNYVTDLDRMNAEEPAAERDRLRARVAKLEEAGRQARDLLAVYANQDAITRKAAGILSAALADKEQP